MDYKKNRILLSLNQMSIDELWGLISEQDYSLKEMEEHGLLSESISKLKERQIIQDKIKSAADDKAATDESDRKIALTEKAVKEAYLLDICQQIEDDKHNVSKIQSLLKEQDDLEELLLKRTIITAEEVSKIKEYKKIVVEHSTWDNLPPLPDKRTDVYFFGVTGSGKSCVLASLFRYFERSNRLMADNSNATGVKYRDTLMNEIGNGILPHATHENAINYIPIKLKNLETNVIHPLNFIEMSGASFKQASEEGLGSENLVRLKNYLDNDNKKLIFFVLDYFQGTTSTTAQNQSVFINFLEWLDINGILNKTDGIYFLLSKSDLLPNGVTNVEFADKFIDQNYGAFKENVKDKKEKHRNKFKIFLFPYSLGEVKFGGLLVRTNMFSAENVCAAIMRHSFFRRTTFFGKLFNN